MSTVIFKPSEPMHTLYQYFIGQLKQQEIENYNQKHHDYLVRSGKLKEGHGMVRRPNARNVDQNQNNGNSSGRQPSNHQDEKGQNRGIVQAKSRRQREFNRPTKNTGLNTVTQQRASQFDRQQKKAQEKAPNSRAINNHEGIPLLPKPANQYQRPIKIDLKVNEMENIINPNPEILKQKLITQSTEVHKKQVEIKQYQEVELAECQDCGRKFRPDVLQKHMKVCQKVFQEKRKPFQIKKTDQQAQLLRKKASMNSEGDDKKAEKWKKESESFRNALKRARGEKVDAVEQDDRIGCPTCGRKFNQKAASRHIQFCGKKNRK